MQTGMKPLALILMATIGLLVAKSSQAQTEPAVTSPATQTTTYQQRSEATSSQTKVFHPEVKATPIPTLVPLVMNHAVHTAPAVVRQLPGTEPAQEQEQRAPIVVYDGKLILPAATPSGQKIVTQPETTAEYKRNVKSGKWKAPGTESND